MSEKKPVVKKTAKRKPSAKTVAKKAAEEALVEANHFRQHLINEELLSGTTRNRATCEELSRIHRFRKDLLKSIELDRFVAVAQTFGLFFIALALYLK